MYYAEGNTNRCTNCIFGIPSPNRTVMIIITVYDNRAPN